MGFCFQSVRNNDKKIKTFTAKIITDYLVGLLVAKERRNCSNIARYLKCSHDKIYRFFRFTGSFLPALSNIPLKMAIELAKTSKLSLLIIDDSSITKVFARFIEGVCYGYSSIFNRPVKGYNLVVVAWCNGIVSIPIGFKFWVNRKCAGSNYKTKSDLAREIIEEVYTKIKFDFLLMDGLYCTVQTMLFCDERKIKFVMRVHRNRRVKTSDGEISKLFENKHLKLIRNQRCKTIYAKYYCVWRYFTVEKRKNKNGKFEIVFLVSNACLRPCEYVKIYAKRWEIEKIFRTLKHNLGIGECQSISAQKQSAHIFATFVAFSFLQLLKIREKNYKPFIPPEEFIFKIRWQNQPPLHNLFNDLMGTFMS